jgi:hypothetical protein
VVERVMAVTLKPVIITPRIEEILRAVHFYRYMTALDITNLLFSPGSLTHARDILKLLCGGADNVENQYLYRFPLPQITSGKTEKVFTLGAKGREFLNNELGLSVNWYFRPQHVRHLSHGLMSHNLTLTRFLVCAHMFAKKSAFVISNIRISYELEGTVIPDAWILFQNRHDNLRSPILVEIDRGSEYKHSFKKHIWSRIEFIRTGAYQEMFSSRGCMVAYATTGERPEYREARVRAMRAWTREILEEMNMEDWGSILRFAAIERKKMFESRLFDGRLWRDPVADSPVTLLHD